MGAKQFTELRAWQLAHRLKTGIYRFTEVPPVAQDRRFCDDIRSSASSVCSNISEGFGRFTHADFARFVDIARGSLSETQNHLIDGRDRHYLTPEAFDAHWALSIDAMSEVTGLWMYLGSTPTPTGRRRREPKDRTGS